MIRRQWSVIILLVSLYSCDSFVLKKERKEDIVKEELQKLSTNTVEQPPLFRACRYTSPNELELCFQNTITKHIHEDLSKNPITVSEVVNDTLLVPIIINKDGTISLEEFTIPYTVLSQIPDLKQRLEESIATLPKVKPATTRSTPVTTQYTLPIVLHIK